MKWWHKCLGIFLAWCWGSFFLARPIQAASEFTTSYHIDYTIHQNGLVGVDQQITLGNRLANIYATEYSVTIGSTELTNIRAWDQFGTLDPTIEVGENRTQISFSFPEKVVGKGASRQFHVTYTTSDFAQKKGRVLEIGIPLLADIEELEEYQIQLHVPLTFDKANYFLPTPHEVSTRGNQRHYLFTKDNVTGYEGITGTFGEYQLLAFSLRYHLDNPSSQAATTQIALPPDTPFQRLAYTQLNPQPVTVETDNDGNWLATYKLEKHQQLEVTAQGVAKLFLTPQEEGSQSLTNQDQAAYLTAQTYWPVDDPQMQSLAERLKTAGAIYDFLVRNFTYNYDRLTTDTDRQGAAWALEHPNQVICMEFTDLFITLARAAGIPAREVNGFAYTTNSKLRPLSLEQDVLHAWPEYYDEGSKVWTPVDPTWGNTTGGLDFFHKLDLDHFAFVRHGLDSSLPLPAGSYKLAETNGKDVEITFATEFPQESPPSATIDLPPSQFVGWPFTGQVTLTNPGPLALYQTAGKILVTHNGQEVVSQDLDFASLPPGAVETTPLKLTTRPWDRGGEYRVQVTFAGQTQTASISLKPLITLPIVGGTAGAVCLIGLVLWRKIRT